MEITKLVRNYQYTSIMSTSPISHVHVCACVCACVTVLNSTPHHLWNGGTLMWLECLLSSMYLLTS